MLNAVIYARYSSERQTEQSIEGQLRVCYDYAAAHDMTIITEYIDRAMTGTNDNRFQFQQMISDSSKKQFQTVLVYKLDRFARSRQDSAKYKAVLKINGIKVVSATEGISDNPEGIILEGLLESIAEYYSAELSQKICRGMRENVMKGKCTGGNIALGYKINEEKKFEIDPDTAPIVKEIFSMYLNGNSYADIVDYLNGRGLKTSRGNGFNKNSIQRILQNRRYIGVYTCGNIETQATIPPIVDVQTFESANERIQAAKSHRKAFENSVEYLLTSKLYCSNCKSRMTGVAGTGKSGMKYYYYQCSGAKAHSGCDSERIKKETIEELVISSTMAYLNDSKIDEIVKKIVTLIDSKNKNNSLVKALENKIKENKKAISNLTKAIETGAFVPSIVKRLEELEKDTASLAVELSRAQIQSVNISEDHVKFYLGKFKNGNPNDIDFCRELIERLINSVIVFSDKVIITFNHSNSSQDDLDKTIAKLNDCSSIVSFGGGVETISELFVYGIFGICVKK
jgi:DNA invertase Pin-like site-specific DNA recombinase